MIVFREAEPADDRQLTELIATPLPGKLSLSFRRDPSYLDSCAHCGPPRRVLTAVDGDKVVALCSFFLRDYWWNGQPRAIWMLSDFRVAPRYFGKGITGRGWAAIRELLDGRPAMVSVLDDNERALRLFGKPRSGWPRLAPLGSLCTNITPLWPRLRAADSSRLTIAPVTLEQLGQLAARAPHALAPVVRSEDHSGVLPPPERFWGVFEGERLLGGGGLFEPRAYRQIVIASYGGFYRWLYRAGRTLALPLLPPPGTQVPVSTACLLFCPQAEPFRRLLRHLQQEASAAGSKFLVWQRPGADPTGLRDRLRFRYHSRLYQLLWDGEPPLPAISTPLGYEIAWL